MDVKTGQLDFVNFIERGGIHKSTLHWVRAIGRQRDIETLEKIISLYDEDDDEQKRKRAAQLATFIAHCRLLLEDCENLEKCPSSKRGYYRHG